MAKKKCEKCVGKPFCSCPKDRPKDKPLEKWKSPRRDKIKVHDWSPWKLGKLGDFWVKVCSRCGRARSRKA
jgi:hypothetical protein